MLDDEDSLNNDASLIEVDIYQGTFYYYAFDPYSGRLMRSVNFYCPGCNQEYMGMLSYTIEIPENELLDKNCPYCNSGPVRVTES